MDNLRQIIETHISKDIEILSVKFDSRSSFIKVIIDSVNDISVDKTAMLAKDIKNNEKIISNFPQGIKLEVGTPGIGSKLEKVFQYKKNIGRKIELEYYFKDNTIKGTYLLTSASDIEIIVKQDSNKYNIEYNDIISAKVKISFD
ncbi:MAG: hypothetical protein VYC61_03580 [Candidatus Neomarinimicrobiota bacterium]|jgi:ribosome maturation factor RimP|nr:hypothetical protein [Candidatus Neomarinimicrobiota bacterium]